MNGYTEKILRKVWEICPAAIMVTDPSGCIEYVNPAFERINGYTAREAFGNTPRILKSGRQSQEFYVDLWKTISSGETWTGRMQNRRKDGSPLWDRTTISSLCGEDGKILHYVAVKENVTSEAENATNLCAFFDAVDDIYLVGTPEGKIVYANPSASKILDYTPEELLGMHLLDLHPADKRREAEAIIMAMFKGERDTCPLPLAHKNGSLVPVETRVWFGKWNGADCIFGVCKNLTGEQELLQKFNRMFSNNPAPMAVSTLPPERKFTDVNDAFLDALGYSRAEILGKTADELGLFLQPEKQREIGDALEAQGRIANCELKVRCRDGSILDGVFFGEIVASQKKKYFLTVMIDQTARKRMETELNEERQRLAGIIEGTHVGTWEYNVQTGEVVFNARWAEIIGYTLAEISPLSIETWEKFAHPDDLKASNKLLEKHYRGELDYYEFEARMKHKDGRWIWVLDRGKVATWTEDGKPLLMMGTHKDITLRKSMENSLREALDRSNNATAAKSEFLAMMSHELRTPLNGVLGFAELLAETALDEEQKSYAQTISHSGEHLLSVVNDILDFSSIEKGSLTLHSALFSIANLVELSAAGTRKAAADKGLAFRCEVAGGVPAQVTGDERRIRQILINLLGNAVKFTSVGSVVLRIAPGATSGRGFLDFSVEDTGIGISSGTLDHLFKPFTQGDSTTHRRFGGTGLGLAISKRVAEAMGGSITVASTPGSGSTFTFHLPIEDPPPIASLTASPVRCLQKPASHDGFLVLVVDDDKASRVLAGEMLRSLGYRAEFVANGEEAVNGYSPESYSAILMDLQMPVMDGLEATARIREIEAATEVHVPIIALTANVMHGARERCLAAGMDDFLAKPFRKDELAVRLASAVRRS